MKEAMAIALIMAVGSWALYDLASWLIGGYDATATAVIREWSERWPWARWVLLILLVVLWAHLLPLPADPNRPDPGP